MGVYIHQHFGPFLKVKDEKVQVPFNYRGCSNVDCKNNKKETNSSFCPICGSSVSQQTKITTKSKLRELNIDELTDGSLTEVFTPNERSFEGYSYYIPNEKRDAPREFSIYPRDHDILITEDPDKNKEKEIEWFNQKFKKEIDKVKELMSDHNVTITWGFISYQN